MKKDLVIDLIQKIQKSSLCFEDAKSLLNKSEELLTTILSQGDFKSNVAIVNSYKNDEDALKAIKIYLSVKPDNQATPIKKRLTLELLTNKDLINTGKVFQYVQVFLDIPDEKYMRSYVAFFDVLVNEALIKQGLNFTFANFIIEHGYKSIQSYLEALFTNECMLKKLKTEEILNRALVITQARFQDHRNLSSIIDFFNHTKLDNEEIILNCARIIGDCSQNPWEIYNLFLHTLPKNLSKCDYYFEAGKIIGTLKTNIGYCVARDIIEADSNFDDKNTILLLRILKDCTFEFLGYGNYDVHYGNVVIRSKSDSIINDIKSKIIDTNYVYYYMLENSVSKDKNDDINVSDLTNKLVRIKEISRKA